MKIQKATRNMKQNFRLILVGLIFNGLLGASSLSVGAQGVWTQKADMPTPRLALASSVVDGKIYAIGGRAEGALVTEYDPLTDTWTTKTPMPTARFGLATSVVDGKIYAIGGVIGPGSETFRTVEEYDPLTDTWSKKSDMPTGRAFLSTSVVDGKIYAIGGAANPPWSILYQTVEAYDPLTDTWTQKADMPTARAWASTSVVDGKIYAIGGALVTKTMVSTVEVYDPATDTWTTKTPMPTARNGHTSVMIDGKIYVIGGGTHTPSRGFSVVEAYDPSTDTWTTKADMPAPRCFHSTGVVDGKIYAFGGSAEGYDLHPPGFKAVYQYDPNPLVVDFNGDGLVDIKDLLKLIESWGQPDPMVDISPLFGDGIVDVLDLELLMNYWGQPVDDPTLIAHWALDEAEGITAYDSAGINDAFLVGGTEWQPNNGQVNGALHFDGISGCAVTNPVLNPAGGSFSVFAWIKGGSSGQVIVSQQNAANWLIMDAKGNLMSELKGNGRSAGPLMSQTIIADGEWHRIGIVWDGMYRKLYIDDILIAEDAQDGLQSSDRGLNIGTGKAMEAGSYFSGLIDDIRIYNRAIHP